MQKDYIKASSEDHKTIKWILVCLIIISAVYVSLCLYWLVVEPIISRCFLYPTVYEGVEIYTQEAYVEFEDGDTFQEYLNTLEFADTSDVINFYYRDNHRQDNIIYGKMCDIYAVDFQLDDQFYEVCKEKYCLADNYAVKYDAYVFYYTDIVVSEEHTTVIAFNDTKNIVRSIMITDLEKEEQNDFLTILFRWSDLFYE